MDFFHLREQFVVAHRNIKVVHVNGSFPLLVSLKVLHAHVTKEGEGTE